MKAKTITLTALLALCTNYSSGMEKEIVNSTGTSTSTTASALEATAPVISPEMSLTESICLAIDPKNFSILNIPFLKERFDFVVAKEKAKEINLNLQTESDNIKTVLDQIVGFKEKSPFKTIENSYKKFLETYTTHTKNVSEIYKLAQQLANHAEKGLLITCAKPKDKVREDIKKDAALSASLQVKVHSFKGREFVSLGKTNVELADQLIGFLESNENIENDPFMPNSLELFIYSHREVIKNQRGDNPSTQTYEEHQKKIETLNSMIKCLIEEKKLLESLQKSFETFVLEGDLKRNEEFLDQYSDLKNYPSWCSIL